MNLEEIYRNIIPVNNYHSRKDFSNEKIMDSLDCGEKLRIEDMLIKDLYSKDDMLIIETLAYIKSTKSVSIIYQKLVGAKSSYDKVVIAWHLFSLEERKEEMVAVAYENFLLIDDVYYKNILFYYLVKFNCDKLNSVVRSYWNDTNILLRNNARAALSGFLPNLGVE